MATYRCYFDRLTMEVEAASADDARTAAQERWGLSDDRAATIQVKLAEEVEQKEPP